MSSNASSVLVGLFNERSDAGIAIDELRHAGFSENDLGFAMRGTQPVYAGMVTDTRGAHEVKEAVEGATVGAVIGAGLASAATLVIPGVGPVLAAGVLAVALGYGAAGAAVGGIFGAIHGLGTSEEQARDYEKEFNAGRAIVAVRAGDRSGEAACILQRHGAFNLKKEPESPVSLSGPVKI